MAVDISTEWTYRDLHNGTKNQMRNLPEWQRKSAQYQPKVDNDDLNALDIYIRGIPEMQDQNGLKSIPPA